MLKLKMKLMNLLFGRDEYLFVLSHWVGDGYLGVVQQSLDDDEKEKNENLSPLAEILVARMKEDADVRNILLDAVLIHLNTYEIDCRNFLKGLKK